MRVRPGKTRVTFDQNHGQFRVVVHPAPRLLRIGFFLGWGVVWASGGFTIFTSSWSQFWQASSLAAVWRPESIWLLVWVFALGSVLLSLLWDFYGVETLRVELDEFHHARTFLFLPFWISSYQIKHVHDLRASTNQVSDSEDSRMMVTSVAFAYGAKTRFIFKGIDIAEAQEVVVQLKLNCPQLKAALA